MVDASNSADNRNFPTDILLKPVRPDAMAMPIMSCSWSRVRARVRATGTQGLPCERQPACPRARTRGHEHEKRICLEFRCVCPGDGKG